MENNTKNNKAHQKKYINELIEARIVWQGEVDELLNKIESQGFEKSLKKFTNINVELNENLAHCSKLIALQEKAKDLLSQKKLLWPEEHAVETLNKKHALVHSGQTYILTEKDHPIFKGKDFTLESRQSFRMYYEDERIQCSDSKFRSIADVWLLSPQKRKYHDITFDPTMNAKTAEAEGFYNIWRGFALEAKQGDCSRYWKHLRDNICAGDEKAFIFVKGWLAYIFQHPDKVHTALVICGSQGVGKNSFVEPLGVLLGSHYVLLNNISELISNFNFHLKNAVLIHANEAFWGGNKKDIGTLKAMITEETCLIEGKGKDRISHRSQI